MDIDDVLAYTKDEIGRGLMSLHAFREQLNLIHGEGDFVFRLHDALYAAEFKLGYFGYFYALELIGTVKPEVCPPINGRMGKALRFLGFDVRAG